VYNINNIIKGEINMENKREEKGKIIAETKAITKVKGGFIVPSQTSNKTYFVTEHLDSCTCEDCKTRNVKCKHTFAVQFYLQKVTIKDNKEITIQTKRLTYPQTWSAYNKSQETEKARFLELLNDLIEVNVPNQEYTFGRPKISNKDILFSSALKVYTQFSLRRFMSDLNEAKEKGYINTKPCFASVGHFIQNGELTAQLKELIQRSASVLKSVETDFAVDSSGFRTTKFNDYCKDKHNTKRQHEYLKLHAIIGIKTNIICDCDVTKGDGIGTGDSPKFIPLVNNLVANGYNIKEVSADKAYSSRDNLALVNSVGGTAYIPYKSNTSSKSRGCGIIWKKMFHYFNMNQEEFMEHYHKRSNVETTFFALKTKFNDCLKSKTLTAQTNELLLKVLCFNIVQVIHETNELGINFEYV